MDRTTLLHRPGHRLDSYRILDCLFAEQYMLGVWSIFLRRTPVTVWEVSETDAYTGRGEE